MKNKEIVKKLKDSLDYEFDLSFNDRKELLEYIKDLQKKAELGEHYKHLYSELKKQKDEVVEDIKKQIIFCTNEAEGTVNNDKCWMAVNYLKKLLRMLGEIDVED